MKNRKSKNQTAPNQKADPKRSFPKRGRKRSFPKRDEELIKIGDLYLQGFSQYEIGARMGLSQPQVCRDLKEYSKRLAVTEETDRAKLRKNWLDKNRLIEKKLWIAFERSTEDKEVQTKKQIALPEGDAGAGKERMEASLRSEGQCGNPSFISELGKCLEREAKMLDIYPAQRLEHSSGDKPIQYIRVMVREPKKTSVPEDAASCQEVPPAPPTAPPTVEEAPAEAPLPPGALVIKTKTKS